MNGYAAGAGAGVEEKSNIKKEPPDSSWAKRSRGQSSAKRTRVLATLRNKDEFMVAEVSNTSSEARNNRCQDSQQESVTPVASTRKNREAAAAAGVQPRWQGRATLIPDGLENPIKHMEVARNLEHPFEAMGVLHPDLGESASWLLREQRRATAIRLKRVMDLEAKAK